MKKTAGATIFLLCALAFAMWSFGIVGFRYPSTRNSQPFSKGISIASNDGRTLTLANGLCLTFPDDSRTLTSPTVRMKPGDQVELLDIGGGLFIVHALVDMWTCSASDPPPIVIPIIEDAAIRYLIKPVGVARKQGP